MEPPSMGINIIDNRSPVHWRYFLGLEEEVLRISRFIDFSEDNFSTYSIELASILLSASSEVDVVAKQLCKKLKTGKKAENIKNYADQIAPSIPSIGKFVVCLPRFGLTLQPWENWSLKHRKSPLWWKSHNNVKHNRHQLFHEANLKNALNAVSGLYVLVLYLYQELAEAGLLSPNPVLFRPSEIHFGGTTLFETELLINYNLSD